MIAGPEWRNGRRSGLKIRLGQLSEGSNPSSGTTPQQDTQLNRAPSGCRVRICAGTTSRHSGPLSTNADRAPPGSAMTSAVQATRQAAGAPSAWSQPFNQPTCDHADGATLGRRDANASRRPRRPVMRAMSGTTAATGTGAVSVSVGDRTHPRRHTTIAGGTSALPPARRWCDAGLPGRQSVPAAQKAGEGMSGTTAATGTGAVSVSVGDRTHPRRHTTIADGTSALQTSQRPLQRPRIADD